MFARTGLTCRSAALCAVLIGGCGSDDGSGGGETGAMEAEMNPDDDQQTGTTANRTTGPTSNPSTTNAEGSTGDSTGAPTTTGSEDSGAHDDCAFSEDFEGVADGQPWPEVWAETSGVALADVQGGRGRLRPIISSYSLARMIATIDCAEVDASLTFMFTDDNTQGVGLFARNNGGYLRQTEPFGQGLAAFAEAFRNPVGIGLWREFDGQERLISAVAPFDIQPDVEYRMRFRLTQQDASTSLLQTKIWPLSENEPADWTAEQTDDTASLQNVGGALAVDAWSDGPANGSDAADLFFDDIVVTSAR